MLQINMLRADHVIGFAAEELKKYLLFGYPFCAAACDHPQSPAVKRLEGIRELAAEGRAIAREHMAMPDRPKTVSMRLLLRHAEYIEGIASIMIEKALGRDDLAKEKHQAFFREFGKYEFEIERYFDHYLSWWSYKRVVKSAAKIVIQAGE